MRKRLSFLSFLVLICLFIGGCGTSSKHHNFLYKKNPAFYAYIVGDVHTKKIHVEHDANVYATPASCQKVITALLAYKVLGPEHRYVTKLYVTKKRGRVNDVMLSCGGDPTLTSKHLEQMLLPLIKKGFKGRFIIDASLFQTPPYSPHVMIEDIGRPYAPPVSAMILDRNIITVTVQPGHRGQPARLNNDADYVIHSDVCTTREPSEITVCWDGDRIKAQGHIHTDEKILTLQLSPQNIEVYFLKKIKKLIPRFKNKIVIMKDRNLRPAEAVLSDAIHSEPLRCLIPPAMKSSDNLVFDSLYLTLLNTFDQKEIKYWSDGNRPIQSMIKDHFKIDMGQSRLVDGSGLSRHNRIQPRLLFEILKKGYAVNAFVASLPFPGEQESTLEYRGTLLNSIRAKTGNMSGVTCLCGYDSVPGLYAHPRAFVMMVNSFAPPSQKTFLVIDQFLNHFLKR